MRSAALRISRAAATRRSSSCGRASRTSTRTFLAAIADWARVKEQWLEEKRRAVIEHWQQSELQGKLRDIERALSRQHRRMRVLHAQLA